MELKKTDMSKARIRSLQCSIKKIGDEIKQLVGPMSRTLRTALRAIGIELTVYWSGAFVGPQIAKLMDRDRYKFTTDNLFATFETMHENLTDEEIRAGESFLHKQTTLWKAFFDV